MKTKEEFYVAISEVIDEGYKHPDGGCVLIECKLCGDQLFWLEGDVIRLYEKHYIKECVKCKLKDTKEIKLGHSDL